MSNELEAWRLGKPMIATPEQVEQNAIEYSAKNVLRDVELSGLMLDFDDMNDRILFNSRVHAYIGWKKMPVLKAAYRMLGGTGTGGRNKAKLVNAICELWVGGKQ